MPQVARSLLLLVCSVGLVRAETATLISLRARVHVDQPVVRLGDIATVQATDRSLASDLADLQISHLREPGTTETISASRVEYFLLLKGFSPTGILVKGESTRVVFGSKKSNEEKSNDELVTAAVRQAIANRLGLQTTEVSAQLTRPLGLSAKSPSPEIEFRVLPSTKVPIGKCAVKLGVYEDERLIRTLSASLLVSVRRMVPVVHKPLTPNRPLQREDFVWQKANVQTLESLSPKSDIIGRRVVRRLSPGEIIRPTHLARVAQTQDPFVVQTRNNINVIARKGAMRVILGNAIALQRGRVGDTVRLRNPTSGKVIVATLVSPTMAELRL